ncbi:MAG TPA: ribose-5-phosphate isomerase RpiA [Rhodopila sp.]|jgi:ribose 5-phosphate isomerase A|nr:ribose-5-phosphate isomerase RpiA [Rhodopila sp.]
MTGSASPDAPNTGTPHTGAPKTGAPQTGAPNAGAPNANDRDASKRQAAMEAVAMVQDGMVVGLGTGSTAAFAIDGLIARVRDGLRILGIPTSERSARQARDGGIPLTDFASHPQLDLTIDGADEIARDSLNLIKGLGGALLREKIVAAASTRLVIVADAPKLVTRLGGTVPVPVEVVAFGWETTAARLARLGVNPVQRMAQDGTAFRTDGGNLILDCHVGVIADPVRLEQDLSATIGVVETGLFIAMAATALVATPDGLVRLDRPGQPAD